MTSDLNSGNRSVDLEVDLFFFCQLQNLLSTSSWSNLDFISLAQLSEKVHSAVKTGDSYFSTQGQAGLDRFF